MANEITQIQDFERGIASQSKAFSSVLPAHIPAKKFMRTIIGAIQNNPSILNLDRQSVYTACQRAAQDGLILDSREAALVAFGNRCTYMPMTQGILKKLRNSGQVSTISAQTVHANDKFSFNPSVDDVPNHSPDWFGDRGEMIGVYAVAKLKDGNTVVEIMNLDQIKKVQQASRSPNKGPWADWFEEMAKKSVLRRISKYLPSSADIDQMIEHDNELFDLDKTTIDATDLVPEKPNAAKKTRAAQVIEGELDDEVPDAAVETDSDPI